MALFQNEQWAVTKFGLEAVRPGAPEYLISAERLLESGGVAGGQLYDWPSHMAEKTWIDLAAFVEAFRKALKIHEGRYPGTVDAGLLEKSIEKAYSVLWEREKGRAKQSET